MAQTYKEVWSEDKNKYVRTCIARILFCFTSSNSILSPPYLSFIFSYLSITCPLFIFPYLTSCCFLISLDLTLCFSLSIFVLNALSEIDHVLTVRYISVAHVISASLLAVTLSLFHFLSSISSPSLSLSYLSSTLSPSLSSLLTFYLSKNKFQFVQFKILK